MAREFQPLLMKDLEIAVPGTKIHRLALNRHMPRVEKVETHRHPHEELLLYLRGSGIQIVEGRAVPVRRGILIFLKKDQPHGFRKERNINNPTNLDVAAGVLKVVCNLEGEINSIAKTGPGKYGKMVNQWIAQSDPVSCRPSDVAKGLGRSIDYVNRQLKRESNTSLGRLLDAAKFGNAGRLLKETSLPIGEVAEQVGFIDQNYFARWFRKQSGLTPSRWRSGA